MHSRNSSPRGRQRSGDAAPHSVSGPLGPSQIISWVTASGGAMTGATGSLMPDGSTAPFAPAETRLLYGPPLRDVSGGQPATHHDRAELPLQPRAEAAVSLRSASSARLLRPPWRRRLRVCRTSRRRTSHSARTRPLSLRAEQSTTCAGGSSAPPMRINRSGAPAGYPLEVGVDEDKIRGWLVAPAQQVTKAVDALGHQALSRAHSRYQRPGTLDGPAEAPVGAI